MDAFTVLMQDHIVNVLGPAVDIKDAGGGDQITWPTTRAAGVKCLINAPMTSIQDRFEQDNLIGTVTVAIFYTGVMRGDLLVVTKGPPYVGATLRVTGIKEQPGVEFMGFWDAYPVVHVTAEHVRVVI